MDGGRARLDVYAAEKAGITRSAAQKLIAKGLVAVNGRIKKANYIIRPGDEVTVTLPPPAPAAVAPEDIPLDILYEDTHIIVVNKPRGLVVHPGAGVPSGTLVNALLHHCGTLAAADTQRPGIVHRIDKDTTGALVIAKTDAAYAGLAAQFSEHTITRQYIALVTGRLKNNTGVIDKPIGRNPYDRKKMAVITKNGKRAVTRYDVLKRFEKYTLIRAALETGRTHQIRVHMAHIGHPLCGDTVYGKTPQNEPLIQGQALHAMILGFTHPVTNEHMRFTAKIPQDFLRLLEKVK